MSRATQGTTTNKSYLRIQDFHLLWLNFPELFYFVDHLMLWPYNPTIAETTVVWAVPRSLATTRGITIVFSSSRYLDVSVPWVSLLTDNASSTRWVSPFGNLRITSYLHFPVAYRSLSRPSSPSRAKASTMRP